MMGIATAQPILQSPNSSIVGCVERSDTHRLQPLFAATNSTGSLRVYNRD